MHLSLKAVISIGIFLVSAIAITGLSLRIVAGTRVSDEKILLVESVARTTWSSLESEAIAIRPGETVLEEIEENGVVFMRVLNVQDNGDTWLVELTVKKLGDRARPRTYRAELLKG